MVGRPMIFMDAPGYKAGGYHTKKEFLDIVHYQHRDRIYYRMRGDPPGVPPGRLRKDDIAGWMDLVGAVYKKKPAK